MGKKNSYIHFVIETSTKQVLEREAQMQGISLAELCREKLRKESRLMRIEMMLEKLTNTLSENKQEGRNVYPGQNVWTGRVCAVSCGLFLPRWRLNDNKR